MAGPDLPDVLAWEEGLPRPLWDRIAASVGSRPAHAQRDAWLAAVRHWLAALGEALGGGYETAESRRFVVLAPRADGDGPRLLRCAESCRKTIESLLGDVARFDGATKEIVIALRTPAEYYRYVCCFDPDGEYGGSSGMHIREGHAHVALRGRGMHVLERTLAHELTHVALRHLDMPLWLEEGIAQIVARAVTGEDPLTADEELALRHKRHWREHGLGAFWRGEGFSAPGGVQSLCYELAEILVRLLVEDATSRWSGRARERRRRFLAFLRAARAGDHGEAAASRHLGTGLGDLAARFLGPRS
ncbi:MAG: hypothetical protein L6Q95_08875 [Planctomycetes bacterium]|nr:hypothetical protein [Planctomycetota bacterium]